MSGTPTLTIWMRSSAGFGRANKFAPHVITNTEEK
jgi:hypothetical protein